MSKVKKIDYTYAVGRRKSASARVRLYKGKGENTVNGILIEKDKNEVNLVATDSHRLAFAKEKILNGKTNRKPEEFFQL